MSDGGQHPNGYRCCRAMMDPPHPSLAFIVCARQFGDVLGSCMENPEGAKILHAGFDALQFLRASLRPFSCLPSGFWDTFHDPTASFHHRIASIWDLIFTIQDVFPEFLPQMPQMPQVDDGLFGGL